MRDLVTSKAEIEDNVRMLESLRIGEANERKFWKGLIANNRYFVVLPSAGGFLFAPRVFAGYQKNGIHHSNEKAPVRHKANRSVDAFVPGPIHSQDNRHGLVEAAILQLFKDNNFRPSLSRMERRYWIIESAPEPKSRVRLPVGHQLLSDEGEIPDAHFEADMDSLEDRQRNLERAILRSQNQSRSRRQKRLQKAAKKPRRVQVIVTTFDRNPDVIAEVLERANGICEGCGKGAPFTRSNGSPYLEVHHKQMLADDGDDTVDNAIALCPNCHRFRHFGRGQLHY